MDNLNSKEEYNSIPVFYCKNCLSLKIMNYPDTDDYCDDCGNTEIESSYIGEWEEKYFKRYNKKFYSNGKKERSY